LAPEEVKKGKKKYLARSYGGGSYMTGDLLGEKRTCSGKGGALLLRVNRRGIPSRVTISKLTRESGKAEGEFCDEKRFRKAIQGLFRGGEALSKLFNLAAREKSKRVTRVFRDKKKRVPSRLRKPLAGELARSSETSLAES